MTVRLLLVDDHTMFRQGMARLFTGRDDFEVVGEAENGEEAIDMVKQLQPDVVLMDVHMPKMDGVEFLEQKKDHQKHFDVPVVLLTNLAAEEVLNKCLQLGAKSLIMKSDITPDQIPPVINQVLST